MKLINLLKKNKKIQFKCAQCVSTKIPQYKNSIICRRCAVSNKLREAQAILGRKALAGKTLTVYYDEDIDDLRIEMTDNK